MKIKLHTLFSGHLFRSTVLAAFTLFLASPRAAAQTNTTLSAADFQRLVYSAQLDAQLALKPELEASLHVLLEMQRRNPGSAPAALVNVLTNALQIYRTSEPWYIRANGGPDEVLASYLECLRQVPARTNFVSVDLTFLSNFILGPADYDPSNTPSALLASGHQSVFSIQKELSVRGELVNNCMARSRANAAFATAMDALLKPETGVWLNESPLEIITYSPLHNAPTLTNLLALSETSSDGSLTISSNQVLNLGVGEMQAVWNNVHTNLALLSQHNQSLPDVLSYLTYLTNQAAIDANQQQITLAQQGQPASLACATAAFFTQSALLSGPEWTSQDEEINQIETTETGAINILAGAGQMSTGELNDESAGAQSITAGTYTIFNEYYGIPSSAEVTSEQMATQLTNIQTMIRDLNANMNYRFDRIDQSLNTMFNTMNIQFTNLQISLNDQGQQIAQLSGNVESIRNSLLQAQDSIDYLEQDLFIGFQTSERETYLNNPANNAFFYVIRHPGHYMSYEEYAIIPDYEGDFYSYPCTEAVDNNMSPSLSLNLDPTSLAQQLMLSTNNTLASNLNYIKQFLATTNLGLQTGGIPPLANPQEWNLGASAYMQLAGENPMLYREFGGGDLTTIISTGQNLKDFLTSLTFNGTNVNWNFWNGLETYYFNALTNFNALVSGVETTNAGSMNFDLGAWRQWDLTDPAVTATATIVQSTPPNLALPQSSNWTAVAAGDSFSLTLGADGTVFGWGDNSYGEATGVPSPGSSAGTVTMSGQPLTNVVAISANGFSSLALMADSTMVGWGDNGYGQATGVTNGPIPGKVTFLGQTLTNVVAISTGGAFSLALMADGTVFGWGYNHEGEATGVPSPGSSGGLVTISETTLNNVVAIAAGVDHSLALKADGTVVGWGDNTQGAATGVPNFPNTNVFGAGTVAISGIPLANVVAIAAGGGFSLALKADGTVVGWGNDYMGEATGAPNTNTPNAGAGPVVNFNTGDPLSQVVAIAAGLDFGLALRADGSAFGWGDNTLGQATGLVPTGSGLIFGAGAVFGSSGQPLNNAVAISAGSDHGLFLTPTGGSAGSGALTFLRAPIPSRVLTLFQNCNEATVSELGLTGSQLDNAAAKLTSAKMLLAAVLQLAMPYTLAGDSVLHGYLYGSEGLMDTATAQNFLQTQDAGLQVSPATRCPGPAQLAALAYLGFQQHLNQCLTNLQASGQPEIPRMVGQTLRLLDLLQDAYPSTPPPALEMCRSNNSPGFILYGEPYVNYTVQSCSNLSAPIWTSTTITNLEDGQTNVLPVSRIPQGFYRTAVTMPPQDF